ncbi:hypothetical protein CYLTODRAFT_121315 [Cylindrobasidium torrendii FP15055 ss-10]|uniref:Uncharacterized protein n=1 Tax=Cylindrobasidium torrendii FP15055 ss-10 TaxID=1314674 RepID=A0A0D7B076_9AGAR|nr:hypothetical protein CYLTODRAFT_121315 [Cylindrobasidium torrendii FP15055 ss-10]
MIHSQPLQNNPLLRLLLGSTALQFQAPLLGSKHTVRTQIQTYPLDMVMVTDNGRVVLTSQRGPRQQGRPRQSRQRRSPVVSQKRPAESSLVSSVAEMPKKRRTNKSKGPTRAALPPKSRFADVVNRLMPKSLEVWQRALTYCQRERTGREAPTFKGVKTEHLHLVFPDAAMLSSLQNERTQAEYLISFARLLPTLQWRADAIENAELDIVGIQSQVWREVLGLWQPRQEGSESAARRKQILQALSESAKASGLPNAPLDLPGLLQTPVVWNGVEILPSGASIAHPPPEPVCREMLWFMNEANFRIDFLALDYWVYDRTTDYGARGWTEEPLSPIDRRLRVIQLMEYWDGSVYPERIENIGFSSTNLSEVASASLAMAEVMKCWSKEASVSQKLRDSVVAFQYVVSAPTDASGGLSEGRVTRFTWDIACHYIETFLHVFARPPTLPRFLQPSLQLSM